MKSIIKLQRRILPAFILLVVIFSGCEKEEYKNYEMTYRGGPNLKGLANSPVGTPRAVQIRDEADMPVAGVEVVFTVVSGGGSIDNSTVTTDSEGIDYVNCTLGASGEQTLKAEVVTSEGNLIEGAPVMFESGIVTQGTFTDPRDGEVYKTISIGGQTWFAQNLRYNAIGSFKSGFNTEYNADYGRYYNWHVAQNACPSGWHLPSNDEWTTLEVNLGIRADDGDMDIISHYPKHMKSVSLWQSSTEPNSAGTNALGFNAFPAGYVSTTFGDAVDYGFSAGFWSSDIDLSDTTEAWQRRYFYDTYGIADGPYYNKLGYSSSVRCIKN